MNRWLKRMAACLLVLALVVPAFSVPETAAAASKITLKSGAAAPSTIYAGHSYTLDVKGANVKYYSSNKKIATIGLTTGKLKPTEPGSVKITAKSKKTGKIAAFKTFKVLKRSTSVSAEPKTVYLGKVGDTAQLKPTLKPANSTDVFSYVSSDKTIAAIGLTSGKMTARGIGKTTIQVYAKATKATSSSNKSNKKTTVDVYVGPYLAQAEQTQLAQVKLTFKDSVDVYAFQPSDFTITNDETKVNCPIKAVSKSSGSEVTLTLYNELRDGKTYMVKNNMSAAQFTATDARIAGLRIEPTEAEIQKSTQISLALLDKDGITVGRCYANNTPSNIDFEVKAEGGYVFHGGMLYLSSMSSKGIAKATYHSGKFVNGKEVGNIETGEVIITPLKQKEEEKEPIYSGGYSPYNVRYTIEEEIPRGLETDNDASTDKSAEEADDSTASETSTRGYVKATDFNQPIQTIYLKPQGSGNETGTASEQQPVKAKFRIYMNGKEVDYTQYTQYTVSSLDLNIVEVSGTHTETSDGGQAEEPPEDGKSKDVYLDENGCVQLTPGQAGTTKLALKYQGQVIRNLPITVSSDERKPYKVVFFTGERITSQIELERFPDYTGVSSENQEPSCANMRASLQVLLKDQYGKMLNWDYYPKATLRLDEHRATKDVMSFDNEKKILSINAAADTNPIYPVFEYYATLNCYVGKTMYTMVSIRMKNPKVTIEKNEKFAGYDPDLIKNAKDYENLFNDAYIVRINGKQINNIKDPSRENGYYLTYKRAPESDPKTGIIFKSVSFTISYTLVDEENGARIRFSATCTDGLKTISPKKDIVNTGNDTATGSTGEAAPPSGEQGQNSEPSNPSAQQPESGTTEPGAAASNVAGASSSVTESGTAA